MKNENNIYGYVRVSSIERLGRDYEKRRGCRTNVRQLILYIQHKTPSFEKPGVRGIISLCD